MLQWFQMLSNNSYSRMAKRTAKKLRKKVRKKARKKARRMRLVILKVTVILKVLTLSQRAITGNKC